MYGTFPCEYYNHGLDNSNITTYHLEAIPFGQARGTIYEGIVLSSVTIEQTIIQAELSSVEAFHGTKSNFQAWTESIENAEQISGQNTLHILFLGDAQQWLTGTATMKDKPEIKWQINLIMQEQTK